MNIFAGYDCGGTKTICILADEDGKVLAEGKGGPSNYLSCGFKTASDSIRECTEMALSRAGLTGEKLYSTYFGSAVAAFFSNNQKAKDFFSECVKAEHSNFNSDAYTTFYGTTFGGPGIITVSGTGAVTYGIREDGSWLKADGWGYLIGDEGSGYYIGNKAIRVAVKSFDGASENKPFESAIIKHFSLGSMRELTRTIYGELPLSRLRIASAASCVFELYSAGNGIAAEILESAADAIAASVIKVYNAMNVSYSDTIVAFSGSILKKNGCVPKMVQKKLAEYDRCNFRVKWPEIPPAAAALLLSYGIADGKSYSKAADRIINECRISDNDGR